MTRKFKIILCVCVITILCNAVIKFLVIDKQTYQILVLQKVITSARSGKYLTSEIAKPDESDKLTHVQKLLRQIPREDLFTSYADTIRTMVENNNLKLDNTLAFRYAKTDHSELLKYDTRIVIRGTYSKLKSLLSDINNIPGLISINSVRIHRDDADAGQILLTVKISLFFRSAVA